MTKLYLLTEETMEKMAEIVSDSRQEVFSTPLDSKERFARDNHINGYCECLSDIKQSCGVDTQKIIDNYAHDFRDTVVCCGRCSRVYR